MEKVSVVIPTHNRPESAMELVSDLELQNATRFQIEALVVSNLPNPELESQINELDNSDSFCARYLCSFELGVNRARNLGAQNAQGDIIVFLDDDCRIKDRFYLEKTLQKHSEYPEAAAIGGFYKASKHQGALEKAYATNAQSWLEGSVFEDNKSHQLIGGNMSFKAQVLKSKTRFNEKIRFGGSETELFSRLHEAGEEIRLVRDLDVIHDSPLGLNDFVRKAFMQGMGRSQISFSARKEVNATTQVVNSRLQTTLLSLYGFLFLWGYFYASSNDKSRFFRNVFSSFKKALEGAPEEMLVEVSGLAKEYHTLRLPKFLNPKSVFHWTKGNIWKVGAILTSPLHWLKLNSWPTLKAFSSAPFHWSKTNVWPKLITLFHAFRKHVYPKLVWCWEIVAYVGSRPYHWGKRAFYPLSIKLYHLVRANITPQMINAYYKCKYYVTRPYHWANLYLWPATVRVFHWGHESLYPAAIQLYHKCVYVVSRPYHWSKQFLKPVLIKTYHVLKQSLYYSSKQYLWPLVVKLAYFSKYLLSRPYHWTRSYLTPFVSTCSWKLPVLWLRIRSNVWRINAALAFPYHQARLHAWKLKQAYYYFVYKSYVFFPFRKTYYFTKFQLMKLKPVDRPKRITP